MASEALVLHGVDDLSKKTANSKITYQWVNAVIYADQREKSFLVYKKKIA